jgi:acyl-CoA hydrolase
LQFTSPIETGDTLDFTANVPSLWDSVDSVDVSAITAP